jgi:hypothetical protein
VTTNTAPALISNHIEAGSDRSAVIAIVGAERSGTSGSRL